MKKMTCSFFGASIFFILVSCQQKTIGHVLSAKDRPPSVVAKTSGGVAEPAFKTPLWGTLRQLTYDGLRSGEGYFSREGRQLIFQSEREPGNPFYQIYLKDLETGSVRRISNGQGKTTCAWFHPNGQKVLFSSTHLDQGWQQKAQEEFKLRQKGQRVPYSWSYDEYFDIFEADLSSGKIRPLTLHPGYDAEASYSPDGKDIVFASNRQAYLAQNSAEEQKKRQEDPSYFMDLYIMKADGKKVRRLTTTPGYDGGPFFSADGKKIVWRHFSIDGRRAEIWTMNRDGSHSEQITHMNVMSWAPFFHPSGDYIIFASNLYGHDNFELFIVDTQGLRVPVRVTDSPGFDGLPVFSPDGQHLSWTKRNEKGESQIYLSNWDDQLARELLNLPSLKEMPQPFPSRAEITEGELRQWVENLSSEKMAGRETGSEEEALYQNAVIKFFQKEGLTPWGDQGFQNKYSFIGGVRLGAQNQLNIQVGEHSFPAEVSRDWMPLANSKSGAFPAGDLIWAGYGIVAPPVPSSLAGSSSEVWDKKGYDSYKDLNVKGKWVLVLKDRPENISQARRFHLNLYARVEQKALYARQQGALGLIVVGDETLVRDRTGQSLDSGIPVLEITPTLASKILVNFPLQEWRKKLDAGELISASLPPIKISAQIQLDLERKLSANVVSVLKVPQAESTIVIGAHGDHLGQGYQGRSLAVADEKGKIHFGADDNASGVAAVLELAQYFARKQKAGQLKLQQNLAFAIWTGEELGVLGSQAFLKSIKPQAIKSQEISAYINLDMVGRLRDRLFIQGTGSSSQWPQFVEFLAGQQDVPLSILEDPYLPTDALSFYLKGIPVLSFFTGPHAEYHSPRDQAYTLNYPGLTHITKMVAHLTRLLATDKTSSLKYQKVEGQQRGLATEGRNFRLYLGTVPDYSQESSNGVRIAGTTKGSPAEKAGLLAGDVMVQLGDTPLRHLQDYVYCLQSMKANEPADLKVLRSGQLVHLKIVPIMKGM